MSFTRHCIYGVTVALLFAGLSCVYVSDDVNYLPKGVISAVTSCWSYSWDKFASAAVKLTCTMFGQLEELNEYIFWICHKDSYVPEPEDLHQYKNAIHLVVVACGNRLEETLVNIKSSQLFAQSQIIYHIFAEEELHAGFKEGINAWPIHFRKNLLYTLYPITYPDDGNQKNWKKLFKPCASQRLFLPLVLSEAIDSVLYVDTDILFLNAVEEFWSFFNKFNDTQLSSLCVEHVVKGIGWYNRFARHPYYGTTGVNSGVMLMNLTRIRRSMFKNDLNPNPMGWGEMLLPLYNKYRFNITWGDQDLLNIVFHYNPEMLHIFPCQWNFRPDHCMYGQNCMEARDEGVKVMHGNRGVYHNEKQPAFKAVYEAIRDYGYQRNLTEFLVEPLEVALSKTSETYCGKESEAILKGLKISVQNMT